MPRVLDLAATDAVSLLETQGFKPRRSGTASGRVIAQTPRPGRPAKRGSIVKVTISRGPPGGPRRILLRSRAARVGAPIGNPCGRGPDEGLGVCTYADFPGHPSRRILPVHPGGVLDIDTRRYAQRVVVRLTDGVRAGGSAKGTLGPDLQATRTDNSGRRWRVRLPDPLDPARGVSVVVSYADCSREFGYCAHYYARARSGRPANGGTGRPSGS